jgi:2-polyprenyl-3-methyl-5-hydroxy-6-metoxy-1,4-benzoquinol methylase
MPKEFERFNQKWGAPDGSRFYKGLQRLPKVGHALRETTLKSVLRYRGCFSFQPNSDTRTFEYPWCFYATELRAGMRAVDLGGSLAGFQFVLSKSGLEVINVDPGMDSHGRGWPVDEGAIRLLNSAFGTNVRLENCFLSEAHIEPASVDRVFSISVVEHIPEEEIKQLIRKVWEILKPEGLFVATVDLFLNLRPFSSREVNEFGTNVPITTLVHAAPFQIIVGRPAELYGFPEFSVDSCMRQVDQLVLGRYPVLVQCIVLRKVGY